MTCRSLSRGMDSSTFAMLAPHLVLNLDGKRAADALQDEIGSVLSMVPDFGVDTDSSAGLLTGRLADVLARPTQNLRKLV